MTSGNSQRRCVNDRQRNLQEIVKTAIDEDIGRGDLTSLACLEANPLTARIIAKSGGVLSGTAAARRTFEIIDSANDISFHRQDGERFSAGEEIALINGFNQTVLASERVALNFLGHLSGIATLTRSFVDAVAGTRARILDTRKTTPGLRLLEKQAVLHGGGLNHRFGLYDMVLIKDNHIAAAGSIGEAVRRFRDYVDTPEFRLQFDCEAERLLIEVEVESEAQLREAITAGIDRILLDNRSVEQLTALVTIARSLNPAVELEASGNVRLDTVHAIAGSGVDYISVGALTHSAPIVDFSMRVSS